MTEIFHVEGLKELNEQLKRLEKMSRQKRAAREALKKAGRPIALDAQSRAPRNTGGLQGTAGIGTRLTKNQRLAQAAINDKDAVQMYIGFGHFGSMTEYGNIHAAPKPFLRPAWESGKGQVVDDIKRELALSLDKALAREAKLRAKGKL